MAQQSQTDICNSALNRLGAKTILNINENSREARACQVQYDSNRRDELRKYRWNFAIQRVQLAPDSVGPDFDFDYSFTIPSDCLRVLLPNTTNLDWVLEGRKILTNDPQKNVTIDGTTTTTSAFLNLRYIADVEDPVQWDPSFYNLVSIALAIDLCEIITQSNTKKQMLNAEYNDAVRGARLASAFEKIPTEAPTDTWILARL